MHRPTDTRDGTGEDEDDRWDVEWSTGPLRLDEDETVALEDDEDDDGLGAAEAYAAAREERRQRLRQERARLVRRRRRRAGLVLVLVPAAVVAVVVARQLEQPSLTLAGPPSGALLGRGAAADLRFAARGEPGELRWVLDGRAVTPKATTTGLLVLRPHGLREGEHTLAVTRPGGHVLAPSTTRTLRFRVDATAPLVHLARPAVALPGQPLNVAGTVEAGATLKADGRAVPVRHGRFALHLATPPRDPVTLQARDAAGNVSRWRMPVFVGARRPGAPIRAVHVTAFAWADPTLRRGILDLIDQGRINAVELDVKDEAGVVGWNAPVPRAHAIGAVQPVFALQAAVRQLHGRGVRVIGRLVCFRDPVLANAAWKAGERDQVVQTPSGGPYAGYGGFSNPASPAVRAYNVALAVAASKAGVDDILYDYVRRPDGPISSMVFPGLKGTPEHTIVEFLTETRQALPHRTFLGASVFGVAATRPTEVAQDIPAMAREVDYIAPMVYPSHWSPGEYQVADPNHQPYEIVHRSLADFALQVRGTGARIVPWLQDFSLGATYGPTEVRAQIRAAADDGMPEFVLWDAGVTYTGGALDSERGGPSPLGTAPPRAPAGAVALLRVGATAGAGAKARAVKSTQPGNLPPNELGGVPVLMHHEIRPDRAGDYDQTPAEFRAELTRLWRGGYVPVRASDLAAGTLNVPKGKTPVVMTFDDSTRYQFAYRNGRLDPTTALGIMEAFARSHPGFVPAGTFYVLREPFGGTTRGPAMLRWLAAHGFELGNHTYDHTPLDTLDATGVQRELALGAKVIEDAVPGYVIRTMALPLGEFPTTHSLAASGSWGGSRYGPYAVFLVGAGPSPSPFARTFDRHAIPRIRSSHAGWDGTRDFAAAYWLNELDQHPGERYVSDGDPGKVTYPDAEQGQLAPAFEANAAPY